MKHNPFKISQSEKNRIKNLHEVVKHTPQIDSTLNYRITNVINEGQELYENLTCDMGTDGMACTCPGDCDGGSCNASGTCGAGNCDCGTGAGMVSGGPGKTKSGKASTSTTSTGKKANKRQTEGNTYQLPERYGRRRMSESQLVKMISTISEEQELKEAEACGTVDDCYYDNATSCTNGGCVYPKPGDDGYDDWKTTGGGGGGTKGVKSKAGVGKPSCGSAKGCVDKLMSMGKKPRSKSEMIKMLSESKNRRRYLYEEEEDPGFWEEAWEMFKEVLSNGYGGGMVTTGGGTGGGKSRGKKLNERKLNNIVRKVISESQLLLERPCGGKCPSGQTCMASTQHPGTCCCKHGDWNCCWDGGSIAGGGRGKDNYAVKTVGRTGGPEPSGDWAEKLGIDEELGMTRSGGKTRRYGPSDDIHVQYPDYGIPGAGMSIDPDDEEEEECPDGTCPGMMEERIANIVRRVVNETQLLNEEPKMCDTYGGNSFNCRRCCSCSDTASSGGCGSCDEADPIGCPSGGGMLADTPGKTRGGKRGGPYVKPFDVDDLDNASYWEDMSEDEARAGGRKSWKCWWSRGRAWGCDELSKGLDQ